LRRCGLVPAALKIGRRFDVKVEALAERLDRLLKLDVVEHHFERGGVQRNDLGRRLLITLMAELHSVAESLPAKLDARREVLHRRSRSRVLR
jgi:hypothetical protein